MKRVAEMGTGLRLAICDLSTSPYVDLAGAEMLAGLHGELDQPMSACKLSKPVLRCAIGWRRRESKKKLAESADLSRWLMQWMIS